MCFFQKFKMAGYSLFYNITMLIIDHMIQIIYVLALQLCNCNQKCNVCKCAIGIGLELEWNLVPGFLKSAGSRIFYFHKMRDSGIIPRDFSKFTLHSQFTTSTSHTRKLANLEAAKSWNLPPLPRLPRRALIEFVTKCLRLRQFLSVFCMLFSLFLNT